jgi:hypothetical protein
LLVSTFLLPAVQYTGQRDLAMGTQTMLFEQATADWLMVLWSVFTFWGNNATAESST